MKENELRENSECYFCKKGIAHTGIPLFWTVDLKRHGLRKDAIDRQQGLSMLLGGNALLAKVMGTDEEMTEVISSKKVSVCETCAANVQTSIIEMGLKEDAE